MDQPVLAETIRLALNHGRFNTRTVSDEAQAIALLDESGNRTAVSLMNKTTPASTLSSRGGPSANRSPTRTASSASTPITLPPPQKKLGHPQAAKLASRID
jgi:hypothetical protein